MAWLDGEKERVAICTALQLTTFWTLSRFRPSADTRPDHCPKMASMDNRRQKSANPNPTVAVPDEAQGRRDGYEWRGWKTRRPHATARANSGMRRMRPREPSCRATLSCGGLSRTKLGAVVALCSCIAPCLEEQLASSCLLLDSRPGCRASFLSRLGSPVLPVLTQFGCIISTGLSVSLVSCFDEPPPFLSTLRELPSPPPPVTC